MKKLIIITVLLLTLSCSKEADMNIYPLQGTSWRVQQSAIILPNTLVVLLHDRVIIGGNEYPATWLDFGTIITNALPCGEIALTIDAGQGSGYLQMRDCAGNTAYMIQVN